MANEWKDLAETKRNAILAAIPEEWRIKNPPIKEQIDVTGPYVHQYLTKREIEITETTADDIVKQTTTGTWTAVEVTKAFCHRAALAHQLLHCLHEIFFDAAIADAEKLDAYFSEHKKPVGSLHGLPVSLKDQFHVKGVETTMGYVGWIGTFEGKKGTGKEKVFESEMVKELRALGAVLYVKTSVPHTLMSGETHNNIIGYTLNPKNRQLTSGGSSGGEGALIGIKGSPVGFGTDIGGSIRIPAAFNGLYGLRPSVGRLPYSGMANSMDGQNTVLSVVGPLATSIPSLRLVTKALLSKKPWLYDPMTHEIPWRTEHEAEFVELEKNKLCFGVFRADGQVNPTPPVKRAIEEAVQKLKAAGHEVIDWTPPSHKVLIDEGFKSWIYDGGRDVKNAFDLSGEAMADQVKIFSSLQKEFTATEIAATNVKLRELKEEYLKYWNSTEEKTSTGRPVDAFICPLAPFPAARPGMYKYYGYSTFVNVLDYTSVVVPVTNVDKSVDKVDERYSPISDVDKKVFESYDPEIYEGAHVGLQIVGRRLQEEKTLAIAEVVAHALE